MGKPSKRGHTPQKKSLKDPKDSKPDSDRSLSLSVQSRLCSQHCDELFGYTNEAKYLTEIINNTLKLGESNAVLICGARGVGKSALLESCLTKIDESYNYKIITLNGYVQSNDLISIRNISKEIDIDETDIPQIVEQIKKRCRKERFRLILILDEFEIFCRKNQSLLYNIFDISQQTGSICTIGMTTRLDCFERLEKRVRSRMNHRILHLKSSFENVEEFINFAAKLIDQNDITPSLRNALRQQFKFNKSVRSLKKFLLDYHNKSELSSNDTKVIYKKFNSILNLMESLFV